MGLSLKSKNQATNFLLMIFSELKNEWNNF